MAITQEQSVALQEAIDNLNQSVEINKEVLEIVKSVGNTGVVDIATHNVDKNAHDQGLNTVWAKSQMYVGSYGANLLSTTEKCGGMRQYVSTANSSVAPFFIMSGYQDSSTTNSPNLIDTYIARPNFANDFINTNLFQIRSIKRYNSGSGVVTRTLVAHVHATDENGNGMAKISVSPKDTGDGSVYKFTYNYFSCSSIGFSSDLGSSAEQWGNCYLTNSPIVSSDKRLKQDFSDISEEVFKAWSNVKFQQYRFKEAVNSKGDLARKHIGLIAQEIVEAFQAQGLDAFDYGIVCHDSWEDQYQQVEVSHTPAVLDEQGNVVTPENTVYENQLVKPAGDVYTVRYEEALALEAAYQRWKLGKIEAALAAKGITL